MILMPSPYHQLWFWCKPCSLDGYSSILTTMFLRFHWWSITHKSPSFCANDVLPTQRTRKKKKTIILDTRFCAHITCNFGVFFFLNCHFNGSMVQGTFSSSLFDAIGNCLRSSGRFLKKDTNCNGENCWWNMKPELMRSLFHDLQGFIHPRCRISSTGSSVFATPKIIHQFWGLAKHWKTCG